MGSLTNKVAVVTGAGSGIGRAIATALHHEGATVVLADRSGEEKAVADELGGNAVALSVDVTRADDVAGLMDECCERLGGLHVLVNNAGIAGALAPIADCSEGNFDRVIAVNLKGVFLGMKFGIPAIIATGGGSVINVSSVAGLVGWRMLPAYAASKAGVIGLTKGAALDYATANVRVNALCPGIIETPMLADAPPATLEASLRMIPAARMGDVREIAAAAAFLASDASSYLTGIALPVDGAYTAQ